jgi:hypothetical protein
MPDVNVYNAVEVKCSSSLRLKEVRSDEIVLEEMSNNPACLPFVYTSIKTPVEGTIVVAESLTLDGPPSASSAPVLRKT